MPGRVLLAGVVIWAVAVGCTSSPTLEQNARGLESGNADIRRESAHHLGGTPITETELRSRLIRRLSVMAQSDPDPLVRSAALMAVANQQPETAVDLAKRIRTDPEPMVRWDAVKVIARHGDTSTVDVLIEVAQKDTDENTRREAVNALGNYDEPRVISTLIGALRDPALSVAHAARQSLTGISAGVDLGMDPEAWRKWHR